jgi:hypothetical protein
MIAEAVAEGRPVDVQASAGDQRQSLISANQVKCEA